jgi:hypothetical protein
VVSMMITAFLALASRNRRMVRVMTLVAIIYWMYLPPKEHRQTAHHRKGGWHPQSQLVTGPPNLVLTILGSLLPLPGYSCV